LALYCTAAVEVCEGLHQATTGASTVRPLPRETRRRAAADREGMTTLARRPRTNFTSEQLRRLRQCFADCQYIDVEQRSKIAAALGLTEKQVCREYVTHSFVHLFIHSFSQSSEFMAHVGGWGQWFFAISSYPTSVSQPLVWQNDSERE